MAVILFIGVIRPAGAAPRNQEAERLRISDNALSQMRALLLDKESRTPAQRKIDSQFLYGLRKMRQQPIAPGIDSLAIDIQIDRNGMVLVDINATDTSEVVTRIEAAGGQVISEFQQFGAVRARLPLDKLENLAESPAVKQISRAAKAITNRAPNVLPGLRAARLRESLKHALANNSSRTLDTGWPSPFSALIGAATSEGDVAHTANQVRSLGFNGAGVRIGVLSDSFDILGGGSADVMSGDLPGPGNPFGFTSPVTVVEEGTEGSDEGRAMLQIIHDLAPGAQLFFATGFDSPVDFANNIIKLQSIYNCNIIVDDISYFDEGVFQDDLIAKAVNTVTAAGALYFSSAGNFGNLDDGTSGVWEGDFVDGGTLALLPSGHVHDFGGGITNNRITFIGFEVLELKWSDPLGASTNDYDLFVLDPSLSFVRASSTTTQSGSQDPRESIFNNYSVNDRVVIVRRNGAATRALHLNSNGGTLAIATAGQTFGHNAAGSAYCVAAVSTSTAGGGLFAGGAVNPFETFVSDGPRRIFYNPDGSAVTPGNLLFSTNGGQLLQKPDVTAADHVRTTFFGFGDIFSGTSAAAPHAAAIAALLISKQPSATPAEIRAALINTALDIGPSGLDRDSGYGIVMALRAFNALGVPTNYTGKVDSIGCDVIRGWAADRNRLNTPINVGIYDGNTLVTTVLADQSRPDVAGILGDNGLHGFNITTPTGLKDGAAHSVSVRFETSTTNLSGSPQSLTCGQSPNYAGWVDQLGCDGISGWAADRNRPNNSINVAIYDGATLLQTVSANQLRSDVGAFLSDNGLHGFSIVTPAALRNGSSHNVSIRFETSATNLPGSPKSLTCSSQPPNYTGWVDQLGCDGISGWAADRNRPNNSINVAIYDGATLLQTVSANQLRSDVGTFLGDNGLHGFSIVTPAALRNGSSHNVSIRFETSATNLLGSPKSLTCSSSQQPIYAGWVDQLGCDVISGWAADGNRPNISINIAIYDGSTLVQTVSANQLRPDVGAFLGDNGLHGFNIPTPAVFKNGAAHSLSVRFETSTTNLSNSPSTLTCSAMAGRNERGNFSETSRRRLQPLNDDVHDSRF